MEFFHLIRATQKSGKPVAVHWQTHKTEARASLPLDVALEDAEMSGIQQAFPNRFSRVRCSASSQIRVSYMATPVRKLIFIIQRMAQQWAMMR